jgi:nicotinamidase/pyrazinamidase
MAATGGDIRRALLLIDVQNDFVLPTGGLSVPAGGEIIPIINHVRRTRKFDLTIVCLDWHPYDHYFASGSPGYSPFAQLGSQTIWPDHCMQDSMGACVHPDLHVEPTDTIVRCGLSPLTDSYSAFRDNDRSTVSPLLEVRRRYRGWCQAVTRVRADSQG